jgi:ketosteroid isomerase-like protein
MRDSPIEVVRDMLAAYQANELDAAWAYWSDDAEIIPWTEWPEAPSYSGKEELQRFFAGWDLAWGPDWPTRIHAGELEDLGDGRVGLRLWMDQAGANSGITMRLTSDVTYTVADGKIVHAHYVRVDQPE